MAETPKHDWLEENRQKQIQDLEEALKDPNKGTPTCRAIASQSIEILKHKKLLDLGREL